MKSNLISLVFTLFFSLFSNSKAGRNRDNRLLPDPLAIGNNRRSLQYSAITFGGRESVF
ncbi:MAG: hypothetical protein GDA51_05150 [Ekhidna sp.]|nr:hypothetical protein [Ekhidna sp.]MBC6425851.1 hypothetical protein [Ekhidna sp.]